MRSYSGIYLLEDVFHQNEVIVQGGRPRTQETGIGTDQEEGRGKFWGSSCPTDLGTILYRFEEGVQSSKKDIAKKKTQTRGLPQFLKN